MRRLIDMLAIATFTNLGFAAHARRFDPIEADLSGATVLITGATGGLGEAAAVKLDALGARLVIVGRSDDKLALTSGRLSPRTIPLQADLSLMSEIRRLADDVTRSVDRVDVLVNNVGVLLPERTVTREGLEVSLATNLAGHFLLTNLLTPLLVESAPARVINVTSGGMYTERIRPDDLQSEHRYRGATAYARTKRGQVILTEMWSERLATHGVVVHAMHPGWARTEGVAGSLPVFNRVMGPLLRSPEQGADTIVWLAAADEPAETTGMLWFDRRPAPTHLLESTREAPKDRAALWARLSDLTGWDG